MMEQPYLEQNIGNLTRGQLEEIIKDIVQNTIKQETINAQENQAQALAATFGKWEDDRTVEEIIKDIYDSRTGEFNINLITN
ncbi:hypothetical protein STA3757_02300 [Stanieria sp. NIES-3757]|nr:hypothetical protein STA3757_02300 [Stanieria sp. NIES-3757]